MSKREAIFNLTLLSAPLAIGLLIAGLALPAVGAPVAFGCFTLGCLLFGLLLFLAAKWPVVRRGAWVSFGSSRMAPWSRRAYRLGYALMVLGAVSTVVLVIAVGLQVEH